MTVLNRDILAGRQPAVAFADAVAQVVGPVLEPADRYEPDDAQRLVVLLGLIGAALGRHFQERSHSHRAMPEQAFAIGLSADGTGFLEYFGRVADRAGMGHPHRDTYASLTRWNLPPTEVSWSGTRLAGLPSCFADGAVRTYTAAVDEVRFFELIKLTETIERAVNSALGPLVDGTVDVLRGAEAVHRLGVASLLLQAMRRLNRDFAALPPAEGLRIGHFMDVFRQFAVHWRPGDVPPSGALDPEAIERDFRLGIDPPGYRDHVHRLYPGLLAGERDRLDVVLDQPGLPQIVLRRCGYGDGLAEASEAQLRVLVGRYPVVAALHLVLQEHARMSGVHLMLAKKYLFAPQRGRDRAGLGDPGVVSNRRGTTGMDETGLELLTRTRQRHQLAALRRLSARDLEVLTGLDALRAAGPDLSDVVRFTTEPGGSRPGTGVPRARMPRESLLAESPRPAARSGGRG